MKMTLKGLHTVSRRLASGGTNVHYYAWRGGPKIEAKPGTPAFVAEFTELTAGRDKPDHHDGTLQALINAYQKDVEFTNTKAVTQRGYIQRIRHIEAKFGKMPIKVLNDPRIHGDFLDWRSEVATECGSREADYRITVLARILSWAHNRRKITDNHLQRPERIHDGSRVEFVWTDDDIEQFRKVADDHIDLPFTLGLETGQRQLNILCFRWSAYDCTHLKVKQTKGGTNVSVKLYAETRDRLDRLRVGKDSNDFICLTSRGTPWTSDGFKSSFGKAKKKAGIGNLTFHDTRGTAVVNLASAGSTIPEIVSITGHSLKDANTILNAHYLGGRTELGDAAIDKSEIQRAAKKARKGQRKPSA